MATKMSVEVELLQRLERMVEADPKFTLEEELEMHKLVKLFVGAQAWGRAFKFLFKTAIYILTATGGAIVAFKTIMGTWK